MDPTYSAEADEFRARIRKFLDENLPPGWVGIGALPHDDVKSFTDGWRQKLAANSLLAPSWPTEYGGGGLSELEQVILAEEFQKAGAPTGGSNDAFSIQMVGNTILHWGTDEQRAHFLPRIISGEDTWCQGYSEPDAGSDLANLGLRAVLDGDEWVLNGQKIWTSAGQYADWIFVLCRTDTDAPKHRGISFILCPVDQPGVEVRPIQMLSGDYDFNETFFTDARTHKDNVVGEVNGGWAVAMTLLGYERGEAAATQPLVFRTEWDKLAALAKENGTNKDPNVRDRLASTFIEVEIMRYLGMGTLTRFLKGAQPGPSESGFKLYWSEYHKRVTELAVDVMGADAMVSQSSAKSSFGPDLVGSPNDATSWLGAFYNARAGTIYAGTSQVQRNILGEMVLGLPKEPKAPK
ncbi:MAG: acyl-CoA dehydrogenase family protein [Acidimicrobiales bacterium]|nr:acyl-CoA dehydrogenase family protein [Acidimicrobiales bacterium]MDG2218027.1 acyl-CoA dehydrogenase family protein [Acidimicrobiales bacterium]